MRATMTHSAGIDHQHSLNSTRLSVSKTTWLFVGPIGGRILDSAESLAPSAAPCTAYQPQDYRRTPDIFGTSYRFVHPCTHHHLPAFVSPCLRNASHRVELEANIKPTLKSVSVHLLIRRPDLPRRSSVGLLNRDSWGGPKK